MKQCCAKYARTTRFLSLLHEASQRAFGDDVHWLLVQHFFSLFAQFKTAIKSHDNYVFLYPFSSMAISPQNNEKNVFYTGKLYGLTGMTGSLCFILHASKVESREAFLVGAVKVKLRPGQEDFCCCHLTFSDGIMQGGVTTVVLKIPNATNS